METLGINRYEFVNGHKPNGKIYGQWMFKVTGTNGNGSYLTEEVTASGKLAEAKKDAVRQFKSSCGKIKKVISIEILP